MLIIHTSDNHLDAPLSSLPPDIALKRKASRRMSFSKIIDYTINQKADCLLISGDLFDSSNPDKSLLSFCFSEFERLGDIDVFISLGNHDYGLSQCNFPGNVHVFSDSFERIKLKDATITGVSFSKGSATFEGLIPRADDGLNILCIHGDIFSKSEYNPMNKDFLLSLGYDYIALGHVHYHYSEKSLVYPGCHDGSGFDETGVKGFIKARVQKNVSNISFIPSSSAIYKVIDFDISDYTSSYTISEKLKEETENTICKINLTGIISDELFLDIPYIHSIISPQAVFVKIEDKTVTDSLSKSRIYKEFSEILFSDFDEDIAHLAEKYGSYALKGVDFHI
ncbi:MAG: exonuclease SbcCD subunit D [Clostridia bacterium]